MAESSGVKRLKLNKHGGRRFFLKNFQQKKLKLELFNTAI